MYMIPYDWNKVCASWWVGNRKFALQYIEWDDIAAITREAAEVSGIPHVMDVDKDEVEKILNAWTFLWRVLAGRRCLVGFFLI